MSTLDQIKAACSRVHLAANAAIASVARGDLVNASAESTQALDRLGDVRACMWSILDDPPSESRRSRLNAALDEYEEAQAAAMNAAAKVRAAVTGAFRAGAS